MASRHPIIAVVRNVSGVLARVSGLLSRRGFNIDSLAVGETENPELSRMTIFVPGEDAAMEQVVKQLRRLVEGVRVSDLSGEAKVERELALIKVQAPAEKRGQLMELVEVFQAKVIDIGPHSLVIEVLGDLEKIEAIIDMLRPFRILELARTGQVVMTRCRSRSEAARGQSAQTNTKGKSGRG